MVFFASHCHLPVKRTSTNPKFLLLKICISLYSSSLTSLYPPSAATLKSKPTFSHIFQHCSKHQCSGTGRQAHARMLASGFTPTIFVANCLIHMYIRCSNLDYARKVFDRLPHRDTISWNALISGYAHGGSIHDAEFLFGEMPHRNVVSWNSIISGYLHNGRLNESIHLFLQMRSTNIKPDRATFAVLLKLCSLLEDYLMGVQIHGGVVKVGLDLDVVSGSAVVDMYAKCKCLSDALRFFREMSERNWVSWNAAVGGCVHNENFVGGLELFKEMQQAGVEVSQSTYASVFRSCAGLSCVRTGRLFHGHALRNNYSSDVVVGTAILDMYAKCDSLDDATKAFLWLPHRILQSWNAIVVGFAHNRRAVEAMELFRLMHSSGVGVDEISMSGAFSACAQAKGFLQGLQAHCLAVKTNLASNICVRNAILNLYGKCSALDEAHTAFKEMDRRDAVSWNCIITTLEQNEQCEDTLLHFNQMLACGMEPDEFTYGSVLKACATLGLLDSGMKVHDKIIKSGLGMDSFVGGSLVDMYCKCGMMEEAQKIHQRLEKRTMVSWNAIIFGFSSQKQSEEAQKFFRQMLDMGLKPDNFTYATVLDTCANLAMSGLGKQMHAQIIKQKLHEDVYISSAIIDMYAKCGDLQDCLLMFEKMQERDFVSWNTLICSYAQHGLGTEAIKMFERMQVDNVRPNHATFIAVLRACAHVGLVDEAIRYFDLMTNDYKLEPQLEHYSCMVDIIGRSKGVGEALKLIRGMPYKPDAVVWRTVLNICKIQRNVEVAEIATTNILLMDPEDTSSYVLLSNVCAEAGRWSEVLKLRKKMRERGLKKEPGCSWIEITSEMHMFLAGDKAHPRSREIYERLDELVEKMKWVGYVPNIEFLCSDEEVDIEDEQQQLGVGNA